MFLIDLSIWPFCMPYWCLSRDDLYFFNFFLISNLEVYWKNTAPYIGNVLKRQKHQEIKVKCSSNPEREIQEKEGKTKHHSRRVAKKKDLKLKNGPFTILKASWIPFSLDTPHQTVRHNPPNNYITLPPKIARPAIQQIRYPLRHHPTNTK